MGNIRSISHDKFPEQGKLLNKNVNVIFHYDSRHIVKGKVIRDDIEYPFVTIIKIGNDKYILTSECQYQEIENDSE